MPDFSKHSTRTAWLLALLFLPAACLAPALSLFVYTSQPTFFLISFFLYLAHRLLFATVMIALSIRQLVEREPTSEGADELFVSVAITAYNEGDFIVDCVQSVISQSFRPDEIIIINDGSTDETLKLLKESFGMKISNYQNVIEIEEGVSIYSAPKIEGLILLDKPRSGKADALNLALRVATGSIFVTVDGDTRLAPESLANLIAPFKRDPHVIAAGGIVKPGNGVNSEAISGAIAGLPRGLWARLQWVEYALSFLGRFGWARINTLVSISGCFTAFRSDPLKRCGGFDNTSLADDYEIAYRLHTNHLAKGRDYKIITVADALAFTIVPETGLGLFRQRRRWSHGCFQTLLRYRHVAGRPRFRGLGIFLWPFKFLVAAENFWGLVMLPLSISYVFLLSRPIPSSVFLWLLALKLGVDLLVCWILLGLHQRYLVPRLTLKSLLSQMALVPFYIITQQFMAFAYVAGVFRALRRGGRQDETDSYSVPIRSQHVPDRSNNRKSKLRF